MAVGVANKVHEEAAVDHGIRPIESHQTKNEDEIVREVESGVKQLVPSELSIKESLEKHSTHIVQYRTKGNFNQSFITSLNR